VDLTWDASTAADLAGYLVYRSAQPEGEYQRLTAGPIPVQSFGDAAVEPGKTYYYAVTAVDRTGNESARSAPAAVTVPAE
jgi:fibronectin type 3 domain-containing protein